MTITQINPFNKTNNNKLVIKIINLNLVPVHRSIINVSIMRPR